MNKNSMRRSEEGAEGMKEITSSAPSSKFQGVQQQVDNVADAAKAEDSSFIPTRQEEAGSKLKQEVAARVVKDAQYGGSGAGGGVSRGGMRSSGSASGVLGAANATPVADRPSRSRDIVSKRLDRASTKLNYIPNETVIVEWDESKPLAESNETGQGFNGTYRNEFARAQKTNEAVPGALMFDRSVDLLTKDNIYFEQGQTVTQAGVDYNDEVSKSSAPNDNGVYTQPAGVNYLAGEHDNYIATQVRILPSSSGQPAYIMFDEVALTSGVDSEDANKSSVQHLTLMNDAELVRETIDSKAGDEKADVWSPLARAVAQPTQTVGFLRDLEANTGAEVVTAYRKACTSMAYQINRAHKDGQRTVSPAVEACLGLNYNAVSSAAAQEVFGADITGLFTRENYLNGEASTMIALYDSTGKYNSKADFLNQPRSFRMHLQTADNNIDPLHCPKLFAQAYDASETYSTIDREYDPMSVVCMTDKAQLVHRLSWNRLGSFVQTHIRFDVTEKAKTHAFDSVTIVPSEFINRCILEHTNIYVSYPAEAAGEMVFTHADSTNVIRPGNGYEFANGKSFTIQVGGTAPTASSATHVLTLAYADLSRGADLIYYAQSVDDDEKTYPITGVAVLGDSQKYYTYHGGPFIYSYHDLRNNYIVEVSHPLLKGFTDYFSEAIGSKYYELVTRRVGGVDPDLSCILIQPTHSTQYFSLWSFMLCAATPWILKARINSMRDVLYYEKNFEYPFSSTLVPVRDVRTKAYANFTYRDYDNELTPGLMKPAAAISWMLPELYQQVGYGNGEVRALMPWYTCQNAVKYDVQTTSYSWDDDSAAMCFPSIRSGVKLASLDTLYGMSERDVRLAIDPISSFKNLYPTLGRSLCYKYSAVGDGQLILSAESVYFTARNIASLPRQIGFVMTAPYGTLTPDYAGGRSWNHSVLGTSSFVAKYWTGSNPLCTDDSGTSESILHATATNINRAQNFTQDWFAVLASGTVPPNEHGFVLSMNALFTQRGALLRGRSLFHPYSVLRDETTGPQATNMNALRSLQKGIWTIIQKLPFILSPFDGVAVDNSDNPNNVVLTDPYDVLYFFGLGGFRASDFRQNVYTREKQFINQGLEFVMDPWVELSPIFKDGAIVSGVSTTSGFQV